MREENKINKTNAYHEVIEEPEASLLRAIAKPAWVLSSVNELPPDASIAGDWTRLDASLFCCFKKQFAFRNKIILQ